MYPKELKAGTQICLHTYVQSTITKNSQKMKATQVTTDKLIDKLYTMEHYSDLKRNSNTCYNMDKLWRHAKWNDPGTTAEVLYDFT